MLFCLKSFRSFHNKVFTLDVDSQESYSCQLPHVIHSLFLKCCLLNNELLLYFVVKKTCLMTRLNNTRRYQNIKILLLQQKRKKQYATYSIGAALNDTEIVMGTYRVIKFCQI